MVQIKQRNSAFSILNRGRYEILMSLKDVQLSLSEIKRSLSLKIFNTTRQNIHWHLKVLTTFGLIQRVNGEKLNVSKRPRASRPLILFKLTQLGQEAIEYFPKSQMIGRDLYA